MKNICAIIVTHNRVSILKECIDSLLKQKHLCDIFVVNNNSQDATEKYLTNTGINHIELKENVGGAGGFNAGIRKCVKLGYKKLWLMDDDCIPNADALEKLLEADVLLSSNYGFLCSKVLWIDGNIHKMNEQHNLKKCTNNIYETKQATFVSLLIKAEIIKKVGLPIKDFFIWGDDIEYTRRITKKYGIKSYYVDNSVVIHKTKRNIGSKIYIDEIERIERYKYAYRNEAYLYKKEGMNGLMYYYGKCLYNLFRILFLSKNYKNKRLRVLFSGIKEGMKFSPEVEFYE